MMYLVCTTFRFSFLLLDTKEVLFSFRWFYTDHKRLLFLNNILRSETTSSVILSFCTVRYDTRR